MELGGDEVENGDVVDAMIGWMSMRDMVVVAGDDGSGRGRRSGPCTFGEAIFRGTCSPGVACTSPQTGDVNGDCVFTVEDVGFALLYLLEEPLGFRSTRGTQMQTLFSSAPYTLQGLDADLDGQRNALDMVFLNFVNLGILRHVRGVNVWTVGATETAGLR